MEEKDISEQKDSKKNPSKTDSKEKQFYKDTVEQVTIMPTMIDESEDRNQKRKDLSAIIPKNISNEAEEAPKNDGLLLTSREKELKSDGSVTIAKIDDNIDIKSYEAGITLPEQIDFDARKAEYQKNKTRGTRKEKKKKNLREAKFQNRVAFGSLIAIIFLACFAYYYYHRPKDEGFQVLTLTIEIGDELPIRKSSYIKPGIGSDIGDELEYVLDLSKVQRDIVGEYPYKVTHNGRTKEGIIKIVDTTGPKLEVRETVTITEGQVYNATTFVKDCKDPSNCNFSFQDAETVSKYNTPGTYVLYVVATDAYNNSTTKKVRLIIEAKGDVKTYEKKNPFDFSLGYESTETYVLHFQQMETYSLLLEGTYTKVMKYSDSATYREASKTYKGEANYKCDDELMTVTYTQPIYQIGDKYNRLADIEEYLKSIGYEERG